MITHEQQQSRTAGGDRRPVIAALAGAGIAGPILFALVALVLGLLRPGYNFVADPVVKLVAGPNGWVQHVSFVILGSFVIAYAIGLHLGIRPTRWDVVGPALLAFSGIGPVLAGVTSPIPPHFVITFLGAGIGFMVISRRMAHDPKWQSLAAYALATGIAILVVVPAHNILALPPGAPLHSLWGLLNYLAITLWLACTVVLASRLRRVARSGDGL
ncbi:MAG: DUF998 domain-containing protein [Rubrobacteraceae bacterium]